MSWFRPNDTVDVKVFASVLGEIDDQALRQALVKLKDAELMSVTDLEEHLLLCRGPGIMCAVAAASPHRYLQGSSTEFSLPPERLEFDMRGQMDVSAGKFAYIDIGEVKRQQEYADAVTQLGLRLATLGWFVRTCCAVPEKDVRLVGRMMVPASSLNDNFVAADQRDLAERLWNFSVYVHAF